MFRVKYATGGFDAMKTASEFIWRDGYTREIIAEFPTVEKAVAFAQDMMDRDKRIRYCRIYNGRIAVPATDGGLVERRTGP